MLLQRVRLQKAFRTSSTLLQRQSLRCFTTSFSLSSKEQSIEVHAHAGTKIIPPQTFTEKAHVKSLEDYKRLHQESIDNPEAFWGAIAKDFSWYKPWQKVLGNKDFVNGVISWFDGAQLNVSVNALDRHVEGGRGNAPAVTFEADDGSTTSYTYAEVLQEVCRIANVLRDAGVGKGDTVTISLPMIPTALFTMLACARIGAVHSVVFAGFSAEAVGDRIADCRSKVVVTADSGIRGGKSIPLLDIVNRGIGFAQRKGVTVEKVLVTSRGGPGTGKGVNPLWNDSLHQDMDAAVAAAQDTAEPAVMEAEDPLFILYTSGSTGTPKGVMHTQAGYMVWAATTYKYIFDAKPETDVHFCTADIGWITGHTYSSYAPLLNGAHTVIFEGVPTHPHPGRLWEICEKHKVSTFYTAPTAIRSLMVHGNEPVAKYDLSSLRVLGTVGEPINPSSWLWYHEVVGKKRCPIVDTWWQTETGGIMIAPLPGATPTKPGSATMPFFGVNAKVVDNEGKDCGPDEGGVLVVDSPWPGMMRGVYNDPERFKQTYFSQMPGRYYTGDGAQKDEDGYIWILGRTDDVLNVSGHRLGTAEIESALVSHEAVVEAAVVGAPHDVKGQGVYCYVSLESHFKPSEELKKELIQVVRETIGPFAKPDAIHFTQRLPKTRSGKIMRRILRKIAAGDIETLGDTTTLADPTVVDDLVANRQDVHQ